MLCYHYHMSSDADVPGGDRRIATLPASCYPQCQSFAVIVIVLGVFRGMLAVVQVFVPWGKPVILLPSRVPQHGVVDCRK
ncbi:hypothetical protein CBR_g925 [Chara braunii]|uniref:Uncharacterized protein n=1 Tax=Chara braunii TaxID=69332 RepID=A0A388KCP5_CHABU|nr:hypothetical protein CBR_g925 [Chara braunii]|eukprot:GBG67801.1 hypothetical protein CBR_g925 [Chara braunii]